MFVITFKFSKLYEVCIFKKVFDPEEQDESTTKIYMNKFAIDEEGQFEIHVKHCNDKYLIGEEDSYNAAEEVMFRLQQGSGDFHI